MRNHSLFLRELHKLESAVRLLPLDPYLSSEQSQMELKKALDLIQDKHYPAAISILKRLVKAEPDSSMLWFLLGSLYVDRGSYILAMRTFARGRQACRRTLNYLLMHAELLLMDGVAPEGGELVSLLYQITDIRLCDIVFQSKSQDCLIRRGAYRQAMRLMGRSNDDQCRYEP